MKVTNITYVNRSIGVTPMNHDDFASGRSAAQVSVKIDVHATDHVTVLDRPEPQPAAASFVGRPPAHPVPVKTERPALINAHGKLAAAKPGAKPMEAPVKPKPVVKPLPDRTAVAPPGGVKAPAQPVKQEEKPEAKPAVTPPAKPMAKPAEKGAAPAAKPAPKPEEKEATPPAKPEAKPADNEATPAAKPAAKPAVKPTDKDKKTDKEKEDEKKPE